MSEVIVKIKDEQDLYNPFSVRPELNEEVKAYLLSRGNHINLREPLKVKIVSDIPIDREQVKQAFKNWSDDVELELNVQSKRNMVMQIWMFVIGVLFIALSLLWEQHSDRVLVGTVFSTIGAFSMWEAASIWIVKTPRNKIQKAITHSLSHTHFLDFESSEDFEREMQRTLEGENI